MLSTTTAATRGLAEVPAKRYRLPLTLSAREPYQLDVARPLLHPNRVNTTLYKTLNVVLYLLSVLAAVPRDSLSGRPRSRKEAVRSAWGFHEDEVR